MKPRSNKGSVLVGVLWCLSLLSVVVIGVLYSARMDLQVAKNSGDTIQARYLALAGIEKAKALIYQDAAERQRSARHHSGALRDAPEHFREVHLGRGQFSVLRQGAPGEARGLLYGISDEESRLNLNRATSAELAKIRDLTPDVIAAIVDWRDGDNAVTPGGAEADHYASLQPPCQPRNAPFETLHELLMVRDLPRALFVGEDLNGNGLLDSEEDDGPASPPLDNQDGVLDPGWAGLLTVDSFASDKSATGQDRIDIRSATERELSAVRGFSSEIARAIVAYRGQNQFENLADLLEVTAPAPPGTTSAPQVAQPGPGQPGTPVNRPGTTAQSTPGRAPPASSSTSRAAGPKVISPEVLIEAADELTVTGEDLIGAVSINTASAEVLACLPGVSEEVAQAIVAHRKSAGFFPNVAGLLKVDGFTPAILKQVWPKVSARSETFRILSEGRVNSTGARQRLEMVVRLRSGTFETLSYREDL